MLSKDSNYLKGRNFGGINFGGLKKILNLAGIYFGGWQKKSNLADLILAEGRIMNFFGERDLDKIEQKWLKSEDIQILFYSLYNKYVQKNSKKAI